MHYALVYFTSSVQYMYRVTMPTMMIMLTFLTDTRETNSKDELKTYIFHEICFKINESAESATSCVEWVMNRNINYQISRTDVRLQLGTAASVVSPCWLLLLGSTVVGSLEMGAHSLRHPKGASVAAVSGIPAWSFTSILLERDFSSELELASVNITNRPRARNSVD